MDKFLLSECLHEEISDLMVGGAIHELNHLVHHELLQERKFDFVMFSIPNLPDTRVCLSDTRRVILSNLQGPLPNNLEIK